MKDVHKRFHDDDADLFVPYTSKRPRLFWRSRGAQAADLVVDGKVALHVEMDDWWEQAYYQHVPFSSWGLLPHVRMEDVRDVDEDGTSWVRLFTRQVLGSSLLYPGHWVARRVDVKNQQRCWATTEAGAAVVDRSTTRAAFADDGSVEHELGLGDSDLFPILPLRQRQDADSGRLHMWRKRAREGRLPPRLVVFTPWLSSWLLIDGHVRLQAALEESMSPPVIGFTAVRREPATSAVERAKWEEQARVVHASISAAKGEAVADDAINAWALEEFGEDYVVAPQRVWPVLDASQQ